MSRAELADAVNVALARLYPGIGTAGLEVDFRWIGKLESGITRWPCRERRAALRAVFGVSTDIDLDLYNPRWTQPIGDAPAPRHAATPADRATPTDEETGPMGTRRRTVLVGMAAFVGAIGFGYPVDRRRRIGMADVSRLNALTALYRSMDQEFGGDGLVADVGAFAVSASALLDHSVPDTVRPHLLTAVANARGLAAWAAFDATRHLDAHRHFAAAERYAAASGDTHLLAYLRYGQALQLQHLRHNRDALHTLQSAHQNLDVTPGILTILRGAEAASRAALGDVDGATRALGQSSEAFADLRPGAEPQWLSFLDAGELLAQYGRVYRDLARADRRNGDDAVRWVNDSIAAFEPENVRSTVLNQIGLCSAYFLAGTPDLAVQAGRAAQQQATAVTSTRVIERLANLRRDVASHINSPDVAEFVRDLPRAAA